MDLGNLVTQDNAENGVWFQAVVYGRKQNFDILIYGADSDRVLEFQKSRLRMLKKSKGTSLEDIDDETLEELLESTDDDVLVRIGGLRSRDKEDLMMNGEVLGCDEKSYRMLIEKIPDVKKFILDKSNERLNFLSSKK